MAKMPPIRIVNNLRGAICDSYFKMDIHSLPEEIVDSMIIKVLDVLRRIMVCAEDVQTLESLKETLCLDAGTS